MSEKPRRLQDEVVDGEIVAEYTDTMLNLPAISEEDALGPQAGLPDETVTNPGRRQFVLRMMLGSAAALTFGGTAALLVDRQRRRTPQVLILPNGAEVGEAEAAALLQQVDGLDYDLLAVTAERDQALSDLMVANTRLADAQAELDATRATLDEYRGLILLWQCLDDVGLDTLLAAGLLSAGNSLRGVLTLIGALRTGLEIGKAALAAFREALPGPEDGISWLRRQITALSDSLEWLGEQVQEAIEPVEPFTTLVAEFVLWVLERLPFGIGSKAQAGMEAMQEIVSNLPELVEGINTSVLDPLANWFGTNEKHNLTGILLNPVDENVVLPAEDALESVVTFETTFADELDTPVQQALADRAAIREEIQAAQARLGLMV